MAVLLAGGGAAYAHVGADVEIVSPSEGAAVVPDVDVVLAAAGGDTGLAEFTLELDGDTVNGDGSIDANATFAQLSVQSGQRRTVPLRRLRNGPHQLRVRYTDVDNVKPDVVRNFTVAGGSAGRSKLAAIGAGVAFVALLTASVLIRRRGLRAAEPIPRGRATAPAKPAGARQRAASGTGRSPNARGGRSGRRR